MFKKINSPFKFISVMILLMIGFFLLNLHRLPPQIPLYYSRAAGNDQIADLFMIFLLPILSIIIIGVNKIVIKKFFSTDEFLGKLMNLTNIFFTAFFAFIFIRIILLVT